MHPSCGGVAVCCAIPVDPDAIDEPTCLGLPQADIDQSAKFFDHIEPGCPGILD